MLSYTLTRDEYIPAKNKSEEAYNYLILYNLIELFQQTEQKPKIFFHK